MNFPIILCSIVIFSFSFADDDLSGCKCWTGYEPHKDPEGVKCYGVLLLHTRPCNEPERPECLCSGNVTGIVSDQKGMWCSESAEGKEMRRWPCENKEDWDSFYQANPNEKP